MALIGAFLSAPASSQAFGPCKQYKALNKAGFPQRVLTLIDAEVDRLPEGSPTPCARQKAKAERRIARAEAEMSGLERVDDPGADDVRAAVDRALASDRENARAKAKDAELKAVAAADEQPLATQASTNWKDFWDDHVAPAKNWGLALLGWLIGAAMVLKLLNRLVRNRGLVPARHNPRVAGAPRLPVMILAFITVVSGGIIGLLGEWGAFWLGVVVTLVGLWLLTLMRRERPRLEITTSGDKAPSAEHVRAVLYEMGAEPSRSIELPTASDASFFKDVVALPESTGVVGKTVAVLVGMLTPYSPWRLNLEAKTDDTINVELFRNFELKDAAVLNKATLLRFLDDKERAELADDKDGTGPVDAKPDKDKDDKAAQKASHDFAIAAAAMALTHMALEHGIADVLGGARTWRSVGLEYLARQMSYRNAERHLILRKALDTDAQNVSARLALWHQTYRFDNSLVAMKTYWDLMADVVAKQPTTRSVLTLGARYNQVVAGVNLRAAVNAAASNEEKKAVTALLGVEQEPDDDDVERAARELISEVGGARNDREPRPVRELAESMEWPARTLAWSAGVTGQSNPLSTGEGLDWDSTAYYNAACHLASQPVPDVDEAVHRLVLSGETTYSEWLWKDPQLAVLRESAMFRKVFGREPRTDLLTLGPFKPYADALRDLGLTSPQALSTARTASLKAAKVPEDLAPELRRAARFVHSMPASLAPLRIEIAAALSTSGHPYVRPKPGDLRRVLKEILKACESFKPKPDPQELARFLRPPRRPLVWIHIFPI